jgi:hypothetical protein
MRLRSQFGLVMGHRGFPKVDLPLVVELEMARAEVVDTGDEEQLTLTIELPVDSSALRVVASPVAGDRELEVLETGVAGVVAREVADAIAFLTRCPLTLAGRGRPELLPEGDDDLELLQGFATDAVNQAGIARGSVAMTLRLVGQNVALLVRRASGVRLYSDALKMGTSAGRLRELWRVVESAFAAKNDRLVSLVSDCQVAKDLGFTHEELRQLLVLRGRASHASSRAQINLNELASVEREAAEVVDSVQALAEALIIRKAEWGSRDTAVDESAPRYPFVLDQGETVLYMDLTPPTGQE